MRTPIRRPARVTRTDPCPGRESPLGADHGREPVAGGIRHLPGSARELVEAAAGEALVSQIYEATALAWLPGACSVELREALQRGLGTQGAQSFWAQSLPDAGEQPLIRPLAQGGSVLFGRSPAALIRRTPRAWALVTRGMGKPRVEPGDTEHALRVDVDIDASGLAEGRAEFLVRW